MTHPRIHRLRIASCLVLLAALVSATAVLGQGAAGRRVTVATVNGEAVTSQALERQKAVLQKFAADLSEAEAYRRSMDNIIRHQVLLQEARRRGILVSSQEVKDHLSKTSELTAEAPEAAQFMEDQKKELGLSEAQYEKELHKAYRELLMVEKLLEVLHAEVPAPSEDEVKEFAAREGGPNAVVLLPIELPDAGMARSIFEELRELQASLPAEEFITEFDGYARGPENVPLDQPIHQTFTFSGPKELPDYAQEAAKRGEGQMGLFEREDGSAVIYLVLKSVDAESEEAQAELKEKLTQGKQLGHAQEVEERLIQEAEVHFFEAALSPAAKKALLNK